MYRQDRFRQDVVARAGCGDRLAGGADPRGRPAPQRADVAPAPGVRCRPCGTPHHAGRPVLRELRAAARGSCGAVNGEDRAPARAAAPRRRRARGTASTAAFRWRRGRRFGARAASLPGRAGSGPCSRCSSSERSAPWPRSRSRAGGDRDGRRDARAAGRTVVPRPAPTTTAASRHVRPTARRRRRRREPRTARALTSGPGRRLHRRARVRPARGAATAGGRAAGAGEGPDRGRDHRLEAVLEPAPGLPRRLHAASSTRPPRPPAHRRRETRRVPVRVRAPDLAVTGMCRPAGNG